MNFLLAIESRMARGLDPFHSSPASANKGRAATTATPSAAAGRP
jgi:hypothetical protein